MKYLTLNKVLEIHEHALDESGGEPGVRDQGLLDSAVAQPRPASAARICIRVSPTKPRPLRSRW